MTSPEGSVRRHIWMGDNRSLCDLRAMVPGVVFSRFDDEELEQFLQRQISAPACGPCLVLAAYIRCEAAAIIDVTPYVEPASPIDSWEQLRTTRWPAKIDLDEFLARSDLANMRYHDTRPVDPFDQALTDDIAQNTKATWQRWRGRQEAEKKARAAGKQPSRSE